MSDKIIRLKSFSVRMFMIIIFLCVIVMMGNGHMLISFAVERDVSNEIVVATETDADKNMVWLSNIDVHNKIDDGVYHEGLDCDMNVYGENYECRWFAQKDSDKSWITLTDWSSSTNLKWTPDQYGTYIITGMAREKDKPDTMMYKSIRYVYCPNLKGICQIPNPYGSGFLVGLESFDNKDYSYEMLILDVELYEQGKDAWIYTTGKQKSGKNCMWTVWDPQPGCFWTLFRVFDSKGSIIDERCFGFINTTDRSYPVFPDNVGNICPDFGNENPNDVTKYTYEIIPLTKPFNNFYYVKTDNPNPRYIRFIDKESKYYTEDYLDRYGQCSIRYAPYWYADVVYEDYDNFRVNGGYIFVSSYGGGIDGGELVLQQGDGEYYIEVYNNYTMEINPKYTDTDVTVSCPEVKPYEYYLIDEYTDNSMSFFEKLDSIQYALNKLSIYPKPIVDTNKPNEKHPYPYLATSLSTEFGLSHVFHMYKTGERFLAYSSYPFVLDSLSFPGTIASIAKFLEPECEITNTNYHYLITITFNGESGTYGGAGNGNNLYLYTKFIEKLYTFDGTQNDFAFNATSDKIIDKYFEYEKKSFEEYRKYFNMIDGDNSDFYKKTQGGTWIKAVHTYRNGDEEPSYPYISSIYGNTSISFSDTWIDGRYIDIFRKYDKGRKFGDIIDYGTKTIDTSKSDILIRNMTYVDYYGNTVTNDVLYEYMSETDDWRAYNSYVHNSYYNSSLELPEYMILDKDEVEQMRLSGQLDSNTDKVPESGLIYDGTVEPGTPFNY